MTWVPTLYHKFISVLLKQVGDLLLEHYKFDFGTDIQSENKVPKGPMHPLSEPELKSWHACLDKQVEKGFNWPSESPAYVPIFFVMNKNSDLQQVINYHGLNSITVKKQYHLLLICELLHCFIKAWGFTEIDLRGAYNLVCTCDGVNKRLLFIADLGTLSMW